jgi:hypothetical protein
LPHTYKNNISSCFELLSFDFRPKKFFFCFCILDSFCTCKATFSVPTITQLFLIPTVKQLFSIPTVKQLFSIPTVKQLFSVPTVKQLFSIPTVKQLFSVPTVNQLFFCPTNRINNSLIPEQLLDEKVTNVEDNLIYFDKKKVSPLLSIYFKVQSSN